MLMNHIDKIHRRDMILAPSRVSRNLRGHKKKLKKTRCINVVKKYSLPHRNINGCKELEEEDIEAQCTHKLKERLDKCKYGDRTLKP